jgi:ribosomal protein S20
MPNIKSAKKRVKVSTKKGILNNEKSAKAKNSIKKFEKAVNTASKDEAKEKLDVAIKNIDKMASSGLLHKNTVARRKSRLTKMHNNMQ